MKFNIIEMLTVLIGFSSAKNFPSSVAISFVTVGCIPLATTFYSVTQDTLSTRSTKLSVPSSASPIAILSSKQILLRTPV